MSQQGLRQASVRAVTGSTESYEGDWHRLFDLSAIPTGMFNERLLRWINQQLGVTYTDVNEAMQAFAAANGAANWSSLGTFNAWTPPALAGSLLGWWDAERASSVTLASGAVTTWTDLIGGYQLTQGTTANKPAYSASSFNSRPGVTFDGTDDYLELASVPFPTGATPCEIWVLIDQTLAAATSGTTRNIFNYGGTTGPTNRSVSRSTATSTNRATAAAGNGASSLADTNLSVDLSGRHVIRGVISATAVRCDVDGTAGTDTAVVPATTTTRTRMGASTANTPAAFFQGVVNSVLVTSALSASQAAQLLAFLKARGGIA